MARARLIKPGFYANEQLAECSILARLIFPGLWMLADRRGRLEDRPKRIKGTLLPYDDGDVNALLAELETNGLLIRYSIGSLRLIQIIQFAKHQHCHINEPESIYPAPVEHGASTVQAPEQNRSAPADTEAFNGNPLTEAEAEKTPPAEAVDPVPISPKARSQPRPKATTLPDGFGISDAVRAWAERKGFDRLDEHLEAFIGKAKAKPYLYVDWDQALMNAIREDWGAIRSGRGPPSKARAQTHAERRTATLDTITGKANGRDLTSTAERVDSAPIRSLPIDVRQSDGDDVGSGGPGRLARGVG